MAALVTAAAMHFGAPSMIDPLASFLVAGILILGASRLFLDAARVLLEGSPVHLPVGAVREVVKAVAGVEALEELRVWTLGAGEDAAAIRVRGGPAVAARVAASLREKLGVKHVWVHVEPGSDPGTTS
jgi:cobalt-zinc-cadmium efflux system protein